jgi:hypothetical protein
VLDLSLADLDGREVVSQVRRGDPLRGERRRYRHGHLRFAPAGGAGKLMDGAADEIRSERMATELIVRESCGAWGHAARSAT